MANACGGVADNFSQAAQRYAAHAGLQHQWRQALWQKLPACARQAARILDVGSGPGLLANEHPQCTIFSLDIAEGMARQAQQAGPSLVADMLALPVCDAGCDVVFSSLALQWLPEADSFFKEASRVTSDTGWLAVATLLPESFAELRTAMQQAGLAQRLLQPPTMQRLGKVIESQGWQIILQENETTRAHYHTVRQLLQHFKRLGAQASHLPGRTLRHKGDLQQLEKHYPARLQDSTIEASWQVGFFLARKVQSASVWGVQG